MTFPRSLTSKTKYMLSIQGFSNQDLDNFIALYLLTTRATNIHGQWCHLATSLSLLFGNPHEFVNHSTNETSSYSLLLQQ